MTLAERLQARADNAYVEYISQSRKDECLGWEIKVEKKLFGRAELDAHIKAAEWLGRHRALQEAAQLVRDEATVNDEQ